MDNLSRQESLFAAARQRMVAELAGPGCNITDARVLAAMNRVPRHEFVAETDRVRAYANIPLPIGQEQTISQPLIVALMTAALDPQPGVRVLEIGTGSGYQAAVLAQLVAEVYTIEIIQTLAQHAQKTLHRLGCRNVRARIGDGYDGWPEAAPFDGVTVTCAPGHVPAPLIAQLKDGGRMLIPVGPLGDQELFVFQKHGPRLVEQGRLPVRFVLMTGRAELLGPAEHL
jgi:protein-L-isoaspartate(D-aspartate) O-methyltransferase